MIDSTFKNANILIVDDQVANIEVLEGFLEIQGYTNVKSTIDPRQVVQLFDAFAPDLILLDLTMPHLSGFEVMDQLKLKMAATSHLPILVLTADVTNEAKQRALSGGASDFLTKPFDLVEVGLRIKNLLLTSYLLHQLEGQNQFLEEKVKERTLELEKTNIDLMEALEKAEQSNRLKTAFLQTISHEVRTPLNGILGFASLLAIPDISEAEKEEYIDLMQTSSDRLVDTITNYVDMSLIVSGNMEVNRTEVPVNKLLNELKGKYQRSFDEKGVALNLLLPEDFSEPTIQTDPVLLQKIISHLLDNAIKFTHLGEVSFGFRLKSNKFIFFVKDTGVGIEKEVQEKIFEKFMQANSSSTRNFEGNGLGLSIIKGFLQLLGGEISLESEKGKGTTFVISLPA